MNAAITKLDSNALVSAIGQPQLETTTELTEAYTQAVLANPAQASEITRFVVSVAKSAPKIPVFYKDTNPPQELLQDFFGFFQQDVFEAIRDVLDDDGQDLIIRTENPYLAGTMLSAACMAQGFVHCSDQTGAIELGLRLPVSGIGGFEQNKAEIRAVQACLHVLMTGKTFRRHEEVLQALSSLKADGIVVAEDGIRLLEVRMCLFLMI